MKEPTGQILPGSLFGETLTELATHSEVIVEIGTWHGEGSTRCMANGLVRPHQVFYTVEQDIDCFNEARSRYVSEKRIVFIWGKALEHLDWLPDHIDLLLLDGGNRDTDMEFEALHSRSDIIALDDTNEAKNRRQRQLLLDWGWTVLADNQTDRNGWAIFKRPL